MTATYQKPTTLPRWCTTGTNILEPPDAKKDEGWLFEEIPPSPYENWKSKAVGDWFQWLNERLFDGTDKNTLVVKSPGGAVPSIEISDSAVKIDTLLEIGDVNFVAGLFSGNPFISFDSGDVLVYDRPTNVLQSSSDFAIGTGYLKFGDPLAQNQIRFNTTGSKFTFEIGGVVQYTFDTVGIDFGNKNIITTGYGSLKELLVTGTDNGATSAGRLILPLTGAAGNGILGRVEYTGSVFTSVDKYVVIYINGVPYYIKAKSTYPF